MLYEIFNFVRERIINPFRNFYHLFFKPAEYRENYMTLDKLLDEHFNNRIYKIFGNEYDIKIHSPEYITLRRTI